MNIKEVKPLTMCLIRIFTNGLQFLKAIKLMLFNVFYQLINSFDQFYITLVLRLSLSSNSKFLNLIDHNVKLLT